jgi:hypothetical protein
MFGRRRRPVRRARRRHSNWRAASRFPTAKRADVRCRRSSARIQARTIGAPAGHGPGHGRLLAGRIDSPLPGGNGHAHSGGLFARVPDALHDLRQGDHGPIEDRIEVRQDAAEDHPQHRWR